MLDEVFYKAVCYGGAIFLLGVEEGNNSNMRFKAF